jgi:hypothetical protein
MRHLEQHVDTNEFQNRSDYHLLSRKFEAMEQEVIELKKQVKENKVMSQLSSIIPPLRGDYTLHHNDNEQQNLTSVSILCFLIVIRGILSRGFF